MAPAKNLAAKKSQAKNGEDPLRLTQGESPLYGGYGIPAPASVKSQIAPDAAVARTQAQYVQYFASLAISAVPDAIEPTYNVEAVLTDGTILNTTVAT